jgi:hypothetical protein
MHLFIMVTKVESLEGMEITPAAPRWSFHLQSLISLAPVLCFCVSVALSFVTRRSTLFIDGFRSRQIHRDEDRWHRSNKVGTGAAQAMPVSSSDLLCCTSFSPKSCSVEKLAPAKFRVIWIPVGSLEVKNIEKEVF